MHVEYMKLTQLMPTDYSGTSKGNNIWYHNIDVRNDITSSQPRTYYQGQGHTPRNFFRSWWPKTKEL